MTYDEAMAIVSENVAVHNDSMYKVYYKKINNKIICFTSGYNGFKSDMICTYQGVCDIEKESEWHIYEPATTACLKCFGKGYVENRPSRLLCAPINSICECVTKKELKINEEYNLTLEQAKKAINLNAVLEAKDDTGFKVRLIPYTDGSVRLEHIQLCGGVKTWVNSFMGFTSNKELKEFSKFKFKIVGACGCEVNHQFLKHYIKDNSFKIACNKHYTFMLYKGEKPEENYRTLINECIRVIEEEVLKDE